ncbi:MAG TPA: O-antigen ligase family protein [Acidimicrobiia bacterium]|nr:O-antigen ligase family protein [Acidimicrobiia bacterium]
MSLTVTAPAVGWRQRLYLVMVAVLPLHTVFLSAWISWKPFMAILVVLAVWDLVEMVRTRRFPYRWPVVVALSVFFLAVAIGFPAPEYRDRFFRLGLALVVGGLVMLVTDRSLRPDGMADRFFRVVWWTGAAMAFTAVLVSLLAVGAFGAGAIEALDRIPGIFRVVKPAYLETGFLAVTNWHQDPGFGAAWAVLWSMLVLVASVRGQGSRRWWVDSLVLGGLALWVVMAFSRTGWLALPLATGLVVWGLRRVEVSWGEPLKRMGLAALVCLALLGGVFAVDRPEVGGDLDLQFAFRLSQGWDLLADLTGLFGSSESFADRFKPSEERADVWPEYVEMFKQNPIFGVGLSVGWQTNSIGQEPHNLALELLSETGIVGFLAWLTLLVVIIRTGEGPVMGPILAVTFLPAMTQTVLFEPTWWFAAGLYLAGAPPPE